MEEVTSNKEQKGKKKVTHEVLTFFISGRLFGILPDDLLEIVEDGDYTPIPNSPEFLTGIINSHGRVVSVVDFTKIFKKENLGIGAKRRITILNNDDFMVGILVPYDLQISVYEGNKKEIKEKGSIPFFKKYNFSDKESSVKIEILNSTNVFDYLWSYFKEHSIREI